MGFRPSSKRCAHCDVEWPAQSYYRTCPLCGMDTWDNLGTRSIAPSHAAALEAKHKERLRLFKEFDDYYTKRELATFRKEMDDAKY